MLDLLFLLMINEPTIKVLPNLKEKRRKVISLNKNTQNSFIVTIDTSAGKLWYMRPKDKESTVTGSCNTNILNIICVMSEVLSIFSGFDIKVCQGLSLFI